MENNLQVEKIEERRSTNRESMSDIAPFLDSFSFETWAGKYKDEKDKRVYDTWRRVAKTLAKCEKKGSKKKWEAEFYRILSEFNTLGGRILSNMGTSANGTSPYNCFVLNARPMPYFKNKGIDSMESIAHMWQELALTLKSEGGYGTNCSFMRPRGAYVKGIKSETPGAVAQLDVWNAISDSITRGSGPKKDKRSKGSIRKGAMMVIMEVWHPDIKEFITVKQTPGRLDKFNTSVGITDDFMQAVLENKDWDLIFPDTEFERYNHEWDGNIQKWLRKENPIRKYKTVKARNLYDLIVKSTYNRAEPGVIFIDRINTLNNLWYCERIHGTNPCGEQPLSDGGVCDLGSLNLVNYINSERTDWDYEKLKRDIPVHIRMLDNVNSIGSAPLDIQMQNIKEKRRIGQGILGYGSALMLLNVRYGSKEALELTEKFCKFWANTAYKASAKLAEEKGRFPLYDKSQYLKSEYLKVLDSDTIELIKEHGMRNSHVLSIAPTGNTGVYANNSSGGLEPVFSAEYTRTAITNVVPSGLKVYRKEDIDWNNQTKGFPATKTKTWHWYKEGDEWMLRCKYEDVVYKIDKNRGLTKEVPCIDYGVRILKELNEWAPNAEWAATAMKLHVEDHINTMKVFAKYVDSALSKTVNVPNWYSFKDFKNLYIDAWKTGYIKGLTTYREHTMGSVLKSGDEGNEVIVKDNIKLPEKSPSEIFTITTENVKWYITCAYWPNLPGKRPFALWVHTNNPSKPAEMKNARDHLIKLARSKGIKETSIENQIQKGDKGSNVDKVTRMISLNLRHGVAIKNIVKTLEICEPKVGSLIYHIIKFLMSFIADGVKADMKCPSCKSEVIYSEGCKKCSSCIWSAC